MGNIWGLYGDLWGLRIIWGLYIYIYIYIHNYTYIYTWDARRIQAGRGEQTHNETTSNNSKQRQTTNKGNKMQQKNIKQ